VSRICVVGTGYVGLTTATCFAKMGHTVLGIDLDENKVNDLNSGVSTIYEEGLQTSLKASLDNGCISFRSTYDADISTFEFVFICVQTPQLHDGSADLRFFENAIMALRPHLKSGSVVCTKSTVPIGSYSIIEQALNRPDVSLVSNPEFLREGCAINDFFFPDRIVIGSNNHDAANRVANIYKSIESQVIICDPSSAEAIKYFSNSFLATKISFINSTAEICSRLGANIDFVAAGIGLDRRIGREFLKPGPGWGGSCFPKDTASLLKISQSVGLEFGILKSAIETNEAQFLRIVEKVVSTAGTDIHGALVAVLGLTFKAGTNDLRDSPSIKIANHLVSLGAKVKGFDPTVIVDIEGIEISRSAEECCFNADVIVIATDWNLFKDLDPQKIKKLVTGNSVVDARNLLDSQKWIEAGFRYSGVGK
jgi:UDPglucose 6-dehydrogenase